LLLNLPLALSEPTSCQKRDIKKKPENTKETAKWQKKRDIEQKSKDNHH
jgi:hypothetical protein